MKRVFDFVVSLILLIAFLPLLLFVYFLVAIFLGRPVFFIQERPGLNGKPFNMIKFRSMKDIRDLNGELLPDSERMTKFGAFLRSSSLDELPELWNVLKGEMSLVGPRPLLKEYLGLYSYQQMKRHDVRPGITGLAQVEGRNAITWEEKFALDIEYVNNQSILLDIKILFKTILKVLNRSGISKDGEATYPKFTGNN